MRLDDLREDYGKRTLRRDDLDPDPLRLFGSWMEQAIGAGIREPNAIALATTDSRGRPSVRYVILKEFDADGFFFATNHESRKGQDLAENPQASFALYWQSLQRQVRVSGRVEIADDAVSDRIFDSRPVESRLAALSSPQSRTIASRESLLERFQEVQEQLGEQPSRPAYWGAYRIVPGRIEFWQGGSHRLHDRFEYRRDGDGWAIQRLGP